jgi:hypothetical protein
MAAGFFEFEKGFSAVSIPQVNDLLQEDRRAHTSGEFPPFRAVQDHVCIACKNFKDIDRLMVWFHIPQEHAGKGLSFLSFLRILKFYR